MRVWAVFHLIAGMIAAGLAGGLFMAEQYLGAAGWFLITGWIVIDIYYFLKENYHGDENQ